ncbi:MAG: glycosyl hydrolase 53 family protein [Bacteroidota bacterium]
MKLSYKISPFKGQNRRQQREVVFSFGLCLYRYVSCLLILLPISLFSQTFYFGADQSYVNEMEDCGAIYTEDGQAKDVYQIFADHGSNLVRLRLWHTPSWYDQLNQAKRYSDFADVKKSISRAKAQGMAVLLDFHLSDTWADPGKQIVPQAWLPVVDDLESLKDSVYNYVFSTLKALERENLLPEMVQVGNETNRDILLTEEQNQTWSLDWSRNAPLFNAGIKAVRDVSPDIQITLHIADPDNVVWWMNEFVQNQVRDFDIIGISYYWEWHQPTTIAKTAEIVQALKTTYTDKEVMLVEVGYPWSSSYADAANNINTGVHPDYAPATPQNQKQWLIDLAQAIIDKGALGMIYWEPSWVSTGCRTQWGKGSHYEQATFFDFDNDLLKPGGIEWMTHDYGLVRPPQPEPEISETLFYLENGFLNVEIADYSETEDVNLSILDMQGKIVLQDSIRSSSEQMSLAFLAAGIYVVRLYKGQNLVLTKKISWSRE